MDLIKNVFMIKCFVLMITFGIDMVMIYVLYKKIVYDTYDKIFIYMIFVCHVVFVVAVIGDIQRILDSMHICIFMTPLFAIFLRNYYLKCMVIMLMVIIQMLWIINSNTCILKELPTSFEDEKYDRHTMNILDIYTLWITIMMIHSLYNHK